MNRRRSIAVAVTAVVLAGTVALVRVTGADDRHDLVVLSRGAPGWDGVADLPLSPRHSAEVAWTDEEVVVYGGGGATDERPVKALADGAAFDPATGVWTELAPAPFADPLSEVQSIWTGQELLVVGTPCARVGGPPEADDPPCEPGGKALGAYDPEADRWRTLDLPPGVDRRDRLWFSAVGWVGGRALFATEDGHQARDPITGRWSAIPAAPLDATESCIAGDRLVSLEILDSTEATTIDPDELTDDRYQVPPDLDSLRAEVRLAVLDPVEGRWSDVIVPDRGGRAPIAIDVVCGGEGILLLPSEHGGGLFPPMRYDVAAGTWSAVSTPPVDPGGTWSGAVAWTGTEHLIWGYDALVAYHPALDRWRVLPGSPPTNRVHWAGDRAVVEVQADRTALVAYQPPPA